MRSAPTRAAAGLESTKGTKIIEVHEEKPQFLRDRAGGFSALFAVFAV
jgi:hypothetical protein